MGRRLALVFLLAVSGCEDRRSFDERYSETQNRIEERAAEIEEEANAAAPAEPVRRRPKEE